MGKNTTKYGEIIISAQKMIQIHGYNGFSYKDLALELEITTASIHYHFPTKGELVTVIVLNYRTNFSEILAKIEHEKNTIHDALHAFIDLHKPTHLSKEQVGLCIMLASDKTSLPRNLRGYIADCFEDQELWLIRLFEKYPPKNVPATNCSNKTLAAMIISTLQGAVLVTRITNEIEKFNSVSDQILSLISDRKHST